MTLRELVARGQAALQGAGIAPETAELDAELLARDLLGWNRATWISERSKDADSSFEEQYESLIGRRMTREPIAYIRGHQEFYGRPFRVTPVVLIPRPETELIVEVALNVITSPTDAVVADVGAGSGCIAVTLALERPEWRIYATDVSAAALAVAEENARQWGVLDRIEFLHGSYMDPLPQQVNAIVSNLPYVSTKDEPALPPEVRNYEPAVALFGGDEGLDHVRAMLRDAGRWLLPGGVLVMEFGYGQLDGIRRQIESTPGLTIQWYRRDLQNIPRVLVIRKVTDAE